MTDAAATLSIPIHAEGNTGQDGALTLCGGCRDCTILQSRSRPTLPPPLLTDVLHAESSHACIFEGNKCWAFGTIPAGGLAAARAEFYEQDVSQVALSLFKKVRGTGSPQQLGAANLPPPCCCCDLLLCSTE